MAVKPKHTKQEITNPVEAKLYIRLVSLSQWYVHLIPSGGKRKYIVPRPFRSYVYNNLQ